jgi:hypothetical protein
MADHVMGFDINEAETSNLTTGELFICMINKISSFKSKLIQRSLLRESFARIWNITSATDRKFVSLVW